MIKVVYRTNKNGRALTSFSHSDHLAVPRICGLRHQDVLHHRGGIQKTMFQCGPCHRQADGLRPILARHGITLRLDVLEDHKRTFVRAVQERKRRQLPVTGALHRTLDRLEHAVAGRPD